MGIYKVTFQPAGTVVEADPAHFPYGHHGRPGSILDIALSHGIAIVHACGGAGACGTCHVIVLAGMANLSPAGDDELDVVERAPGVTPESRLACLAVVKGDVTVKVPLWNRNLVAEKD